MNDYSKKETNFTVRTKMQIHGTQTMQIVLQKMYQECTQNETTNTPKSKKSEFHKY